MEYTKKVSALFGINDVLKDLGVDPQDVFSRVGLSKDILDKPEEYISFRKYLTILNLSAEITKREDFSIILSKYQGFRMLGAIGFTMKEAPNIRSAILDLCDYFQIHSNGAIASLQEEDGLAIFSYTITMPSPPDYRQQLNLAMGVGIGLLRRFIGVSWSPEFVYLEYKKPADDIAIRRLFNCPIIYNQETNAIMFDASVLNQKIIGSNDHLHSILRDYLEQKSAMVSNDFINIVRSKIMADMQKGTCSIDSVAAGVSMKRRTFQRRLNADGFNFSNILEETRMDMAKRYLRLSDISLTQVADMLGYSELAAFSRSFKKNTGQSPYKWRINMAQDL